VEAVVNSSRDIKQVVAVSPIEHVAGRQWICVIGINEYEHHPRLALAMNDAHRIHSLFRQLGFEEACPPLYDAAASGRALRELVDDNLRNLEADDSLVLFYAGHGAVQKSNVSNGTIEKGYLGAPG
jgi:uncharacterized caspase-like protein